ncbi:hypothetical protein ACWD4F_23465 [Streptomyces aureus]
MAERTAVVVDFLPFGQVPRVSDVLAGAAPDDSIISFDPTADLADTQELPALAEDYAGRSSVPAATAPSARETVRVVGYCSAATVTLLTGAAIRRLGHDTDVVLVQPTWPTTASVREDFEKFRRDMGANTPPSVTGGDIESMGQHLRADMVRALGGGEQQDFPLPGMYQDLLDRYRRWLAFTAATARTLVGLSRSPVPFRVVTDAKDPISSPWDGVDAQSVLRLPVAEDKLMSHPSLPDLVLGGKK